MVTTVIEKFKIKFRSDPDDEVSYVFIDNFCDEEKDEEILKIMGANFAIQAFTFTEGDSEVYMHCEVKNAYFWNFLFNEKSLFVTNILGPHV